jgi:hypothetical protein
VEVGGRIEPTQNDIRSPAVCGGTASEPALTPLRQLSAEGAGESTKTRLRGLPGLTTIGTDKRGPDHRLFRRREVHDHCRACPPGIWQPSTPTTTRLLARSVDAAGNAVEEPDEPNIAWLSQHSWAWNPARLDELIAAAAPATLFATTVPQAQRASVNPPLPCTMIVYLCTGPGDYQPNSLEGGPRLETFKTQDPGKYLGRVKDHPMPIRQGSSGARHAWRSLAHVADVCESHWSADARAAAVSADSLHPGAA